MATGSGTEAEQSVIHGFARSYPGEFARCLEEVPREEAASVLEAAPVGEAVSVLGRLGPETAALALGAMKRETAAALLSRLETERSMILLSRMPEENRDLLLERIPPRKAAEIREWMQYPPGSAGNLMDPRVTAFRGDTTVGRALARLRRLRRRGIHDVYLVDEEGRLTGAVGVQDLALTPSTTPLRDVARPRPPLVQVLARREEVVEVLEQSRVASLPVVNFNGRLVGVIRHAALFAAVQNDASADIQTMVGASPEEGSLSPISFAVRKRLPWLQVNLATAFLAAGVVGIFEQTIARFTALAVLLPVVAGQSGNTGAQALAVTMRGLALREITRWQWPRVVWKETSVGILNGIAVAVVTSLGVYLWSRSAGLGMIIGLAMVLSMAIAGIAGATIPIVMRALGQDPAQSSSIILTTVTDVTGFFSFLGLASLFSAFL